MGLCTPRCKAITKNSVSRFDSPSLRCKDRIRAVVGAKSDFHSAQRKDLFPLPACFSLYDTLPHVLRVTRNLPLVMADNHLHPLRFCASWLSVSVRL